MKKRHTWAAFGFAALAAVGLMAGTAEAQTTITKANNTTALSGCVTITSPFARSYGVIPQRVGRVGCEVNALHLLVGYLDSALVLPAV